MSVVKFIPTQRKDEYGAKIYVMEFPSGLRINCCSGLPGYEPCFPSEDYPGSCRPIPEGVYKIGQIVKECEETCDGAIGPDWIELIVLSDIGGRNAFLIHRDWNYHLSPGTAGCPAPLRHTDMDVIIDAIRQQKITHFVADYGYGTLPDLAEL
jgi:hypothetical protein